MVGTRLAQQSLRSTALTAILLLTLAAASPGRGIAADGDLDLSFGNGAGARVVSFDLGGSFSDSCSGIVAGADGTLFAVGYSESQVADLDWTVAKLSEGAAPVKRQIYFDLGGSNDDQAQAAALDRSGRLLVAGNAANSDRTELRICRLLPGDLSNDPTFNSGSCAAYDLGTNSSLIPRAVAVAPDLGLLVAGTVVADYGSGLDDDWFVLKLTAAGVVDASFGFFGIRVLPWNLVAVGLDQLVGMAVDPVDGSIALVGTAQTALRVGALARLSAAGNLDLSFGVQGKTTWSIVLGGTPYGTVGQAVLRDPIGNRYWVSGYMEFPSSTELLLSRFDSAGGILGNQPVGVGQTLEHPEGLLLQSDRKLVVPWDSETGSLFRASRLVLQGGGSGAALDMTYGVSGQALFDPNAAGWGTGLGVCAATLDGGRVVLLANVMRPDKDWLVIRLQNRSIFLDGFEPGNALDWSATQP
ncbi:MAG: hypothetical protein ABI689_09240 [Thermoanaerobaculia bacterium]